MKAIIKQSYRVDIRYYADGTIEWEWMEPDTRKTPAQVARKSKWRSGGTGAMTGATREMFSTLEYRGSIGANACHGPIGNLFGSVKYGIDSVRFELDRRRRDRELKKKGTADLEPSKPAVPASTRINISEWQSGPAHQRLDIWPVGLEPQP